MPDKTTPTDEMVLAFMNTYDRLRDGSKDAPSLNHFTAGRTSLTRSGLTAALDAAPTTDEDTSVDYHAMWWTAEKGRDKAELERDEAQETVGTLREAVRERGALIKDLRARAEKAEKERDEARAEARTAVSLVTAHEGRTARDHLAAVWEAAYVPEDGIIPAGVEYLLRFSDGRISHHEAHSFIDFAAITDGEERRLLDPPTPKRPYWAADIEAVIRGNDGGVLDPTVSAKIADRVAEFMAEQENRAAGGGA